MCKLRPSFRVIAFFVIFSSQLMVTSFVNANNDESSFVNSYSSIKDDVEIIPNTYRNNVNDFEIVPNLNGNVSIDGRSGKLYQYDDFMGSIDMYPDINSYDYGELKYNNKITKNFNNILNIIQFSVFLSMKILIC